jgi:arylsulfatase
MNTSARIDCHRIPFARRCAALVAAASACLALLAPAVAAEPPDVLLITIDTLRADHLGTYGFPLATSPEIDALAARGAVFERAIAASAMTAPSHASILTSKTVREHSVGWLNGASKLAGATTIAEIFRSQGYETAAFIGNLLLQRRMGMDLGFDVYDDELPSSEQNRSLNFERIAERTAARALTWIRREHKRPRFAWVHLQDPHGPYNAPNGYRDRFKVAAKPGEKALRFLANDYALDGIPSYQKIEGLDRLSQYQGRYADEIFYADYWVGEIVRAFEAAAGNPAIVLITADHGESMGEDYRYFAHGYSSMPQNARVPFVVRAPGISAQRRHELVSHIDVFPTLVELAGISPAIGLRGIALGPYLREKRALPDRVIYCDVGTEVSAYEGEYFVRVRGTEGAWFTGEAAKQLPTQTWTRFQWKGGATWERSPRDAALEARVSEYIAKAVPMSQAPPLDITDYRALEALGYLKDGELPGAEGKAFPLR